MAKNKASKKAFIVLVAIFTIVGLGGFASIFSGVSPHSGVQSPQQNLADQQVSGAQAAEITGVPCLTSEEFHLHPHLTVTLDGEEVPIPANIGVFPDCILELHTHETDGVIHVESGTDKGYTFADFLRVMGLNLEQNGFLLKLTVNGEFNDNDPNFKLEDGQEILLEFVTIPDLSATGDELQEDGM